MIKPSTSNEGIEDFIVSLVSGKKVLDVGCVDHVARKETEATWLHRRLAKSAASIVGVDILENDIRQLSAKGYRVICGDAMTIDLSDKFDVIVAGELIEHLENPGQFIANMRRHLKDKGILLITTPNPFYALHFVESLFLSPYRRWNPQHVAWFCFFTMENLMTRKGMRLNECIYFARSRKIRKLLRFFHLPCSQIFASTMLAIAQPVAKGE